MKEATILGTVAWALAALATVDASAARAQQTDEARQGRTPAVSGVSVGQRQQRNDTATINKPLSRIGTRVENRIDSRLHSRIDRGYKGLDFLRRVFEEAVAQGEIEGTKSTR